MKKILANRSFSHSPPVVFPLSIIPQNIVIAFYILIILGIACKLLEIYESNQMVNKQ